MPLERIYEKYICEGPDTVLIRVGEKNRTLQRSRMYNSHVDTKGFLFTEYHDAESENCSGQQKLPKTRARSTQSLESRVEKAKKGWETRRARQGY